MERSVGTLLHANPRPDQVGAQIILRRNALCPTRIKGRISRRMVSAERRPLTSISGHSGRIQVDSPCIGTVYTIEHRQCGRKCSLHISLSRSVFCTSGRAIKRHTVNSAFARELPVIVVQLAFCYAILWLTSDRYAESRNSHKALNRRANPTMPVSLEIKHNVDFYAVRRTTEMSGRAFRLLGCIG